MYVSRNQKIFLFMTMLTACVLLYIFCKQREKNDGIEEAKIRVFENGISAKEYSIYTGDRINPENKLIESSGKGEETFILDSNNFMSSVFYEGGKVNTDFWLNTTLITICKEGTEPVIFPLEDLFGYDGLLSELFKRNDHTISIELTPAVKYPFDISSLVDANTVLKDCVFLFWKLDDNFYQQCKYYDSLQCIFDLCPNDRYGFLFVFDDTKSTSDFFEIHTGILNTNNGTITIEKDRKVNTNEYFNHRNNVSMRNKLNDLKIYKLNRGNGGSYIPYPCGFTELHPENFFAYNHGVKDSKINYFIMQWPNEKYAFILDKHGTIQCFNNMSNKNKPGAESFPPVNLTSENNEPEKK